MKARYVVPSLHIMPAYLLAPFPGAAGGGAPEIKGATKPAEGAT